MIRWLHISDLHFNNDDMSTDSMREELPKYLKKNNIRCDYVFCTGDIRTANAESNHFPDEAARFLIDLCTAVGTSTDRLFIVPGNHDVDRDATGRDEVIRKICFQRNGYYDPKYGKIEEDDLKVVYSGQEEFREFLSKIYTADRMAKYANPLNPHFNVETENFNILHMDSTLTYTKDQESVDLVIGTKLLQNALKELNPDKPTVLLSHYPFTSLLQEEKKYVRELLYRKGVCLWLAGHEHDHMVQPIGYLDMLQAGELRMEERSNATILLGEFDEHTNVGNVTAHSWFPEGWAEYPILWHDGKKEEQYSFQLRLPGDEGLSREAIKAKHANEEFVSRIQIIEQLIPNVEDEEGEKLEDILKTAWNTDIPHRIILADGGMGKSTMLLKACKESNEPFLYIPLERLAALGYSIKSYCARVLFDGSEDAFETYTGIRYSSPSITLLIDGMNEINSRQERQFINEIKALNLFKGIQVVVSSRSDFTARYSMYGYHICRLIPLSDEQIMSVFSQDEWNGIQDAVTLRRLLSNPMMITMYKEISPIIKLYEHEECLNWALPIRNATDLLYDYYAAQIALLIQRNFIDGQKAQIAYQSIFDILPAIAYAYEVSYSLNKENAEFRVILQKIIQENVVKEECLLPLQERFRDYDIPELKYGLVFDYLTTEVHLLYKDEVVIAFPHQIYRDFLSAMWIVRQNNIEKYWNTRKLPFPVMEHIRNLSGRYWIGLAERVHEAGKNREDAFILVENLLDCFPYTEAGGCPDYSGLDLRGLQIPNVEKIGVERISLREAKIDNASIGKLSGSLLQYTHLQFSQNNEFLAAYSKGRVFIFPLQADEQTFIYSVGSELGRLAFIGEYLFATKMGINQKIYVFKHDKQWLYLGEIINSEESHAGIFNNRFHLLILREDMLYFYYNNRELRFSLADCSRVYNQQIRHAWENPVKGMDITFLKNRVKQKRNRKTGVIWQTEHKGLVASSALDGELIVTSGNEKLYVLARGTTLLKDGSVSGDGKHAVTLSYEVKAGKRKIQMWNLDKKTHVGDISCPEVIETIHLSENGSFVLGETDKETWVYELASGKERWFAEHFVSNQHKKLSTYGTKVLRKNMEHDLYLYDLKTGECFEADSPCKNARLACFMSDGSIAAVGNNARKVEFKNIRTGEYSEVNSQDSPVIGISSFKNEPFIAVATQDNIISIYHIGDCKRHAIFGKEKIKIVGNYMMVVSPEDTVVACSNGQRTLQTLNFYEKTVHGKKMGWWYPNPYLSQDPDIMGDVLDMAFNTENKELVVILSNGQIMFCHEKYCRFHSAVDMITNFNVDAYDFRGCICSESITNQIRQNGGLIDKVFH